MEFFFTMRKLIIALIGTAMLLSAAGCGNKDILNTNYTYTKAIITLENGEVIEGEIENWTDYGDQIQVTMDGNVYLVHSSNITLINER